MSKLFNPFREIAGSKAMFYGLVAMLITAIVGYFSHTHFPDVISIKYIPGEMPLSYYFVQQLVIWLIPSIIFYLLGLAGSSSAVRIIDVFGTMALARYPYIIAAVTGFSGSLQRFVDYIMAIVEAQGYAGANGDHNVEAGSGTLSAADVTISAFDMTMALAIMILSLLLIVWLVTLMYNAFRISANVKGGKAVGLFIAGFILSVLASIFAGIKLYNLWGYKYL